MEIKILDYKKAKEKAEPGLHKKIIEMIRNKNKGSVLDIAAGEGHLSALLNNLGFKVICNDIDKQSFKFKNNLKFFNYDLNKITEKEINAIICYNNGEKFDYILAVEIIEHIENPYKLIRDCYTLLKDKGTLILSTPNITETRSRLMFLLTGRFLSFFPQDKNISGHINPLPFWELKDILESNGFKIKNINTHSHTFFTKSIFLNIIFLFSIIISPFMRCIGFSNKGKKGHVIIIEATKNEERRE